MRAHHHGVEVVAIAADEKAVYTLTQAAMRQAWGGNFEHLRTNAPKDIPSVSYRGVRSMIEERVRRPAR